MTITHPTPEPEVIILSKAELKASYRRYSRLGTRLRHTLSNWYWKVRGKVWDKYNVIHIKTLPCTWTDRDEVLLHACFAVLTEFVEGELGTVDWGVVDTEVDRLKSKLLAEQDQDERDWIKTEIWGHWHNKQLLDLYTWWQGYAKTMYGDVWWSEEGQKDIESRLNQLIQLRGSLCT